VNGLDGLGLGYHRTHRAGRYSFEWGDPDRAILELDQVRAERGEVFGEVTVTSTVPSGGTLHVARLNLVSTRSRSELAKHLAMRAPGLPTDWQRLIETASVETVRAFREGAPAILLRDAPVPPDAGFVLPPLLVARMPTILFGDGGSAKSLLALAAAASIETDRRYLGLEPAAMGHVAMLDYEMDAAEHRERLLALTGEPMPPIVYVPCSRPLADDVDRIRRIVARHEIDYLVVDSVGLACDGPPEAAEVANRFFGALRELGLGSLLVAHVNRSGDTERPFGSTFWHNGARRTWYVKREADIGSSTVTVGLFNKKANTGPIAAPLGFRVEWGASIAITRTDVRDVPDIATHVPLTYRIEAALGAGARTILEVIDDLNLEPGEKTTDTVARTLRRMREKDRVRDLPGPDGVMRWGLSSERSG
jgi:hypothetical protein